MMAVVTIGFVKDAKDHVNLQGFNVYHKNRLIKVLTSDGTAPSLNSLNLEEPHLQVVSIIVSLCEAWNDGNLSTGLFVQED